MGVTSSGTSLTDGASLAQNLKRKRVSSPPPADPPPAKKRRQPLNYFKDAKRRFLLAYVPMRQDARRIDFDTARELDKTIRDAYAERFSGEVARAGRMSGIGQPTHEECRYALLNRISSFLTDYMTCTIQDLENEDVWAYHSRAEDEEEV
ncbi:unnamed protein product [Peniophora sp. CBMAI 1063]|nr:unnamed protein product [Peniophora sp. CBMAI 1063]